MGASNIFLPVLQGAETSYSTNIPQGQSRKEPDVKSQPKATAQLSAPLQDHSTRRDVRNCKFLSMQQPQEAFQLYFTCNWRHLY